MLVLQTYLTISHNLITMNIHKPSYDFPIHCSCITVTWFWTALVASRDATASPVSTLQETYVAMGNESNLLTGFNGESSGNGPCSSMFHSYNMYPTKGWMRLKRKGFNLRKRRYWCCCMNKQGFSKEQGLIETTQREVVLMRIFHDRPRPTWFFWTTSPMITSPKHPGGRYWISLHVMWSGDPATGFSNSQEEFHSLGKEW